MRQKLKLHPDFPDSVVREIEVGVARGRPASLTLNYLIIGEIGELCLSPIVAAVRADELWRHTCFEAFICTQPGDPYCEFNFAPSTKWAAYRFDSYRRGMQPLQEISTPRIEIRQSKSSFELKAALELDRLPDLNGDMDWRVGISAVIEETNGRTSYWALAHVPGKPDFHRVEAFALCVGAYSA